MDFLIELRHRVTGLAQCFTSKQAVADFLAGSVAPHHWEGWERLGELPAPTPAVAEAPVMADADPDHGEPFVVVLHSEVTAEELGASAIAEGSSDTYLPVDQGAAG